MKCCIILLHLQQQECELWQLLYLTSQCTLLSLSLSDVPSLWSERSHSGFPDAWLMGEVDLEWPTVLCDSSSALVCLVGTHETLVHWAHSVLIKLVGSLFSYLVQWEHPSLDEISLAAANHSSGLKDHVKNLGSKNPFYSRLDGSNGLQTPCFVGLIITVPVMLMFLTYKEKSTPRCFYFIL